MYSCMNENLTQRSINSFLWKTAQSICSLGSTFIIQIVLARILNPTDFGIVAITTVFMTLANTIVETSFSSSVIQRKELDPKLLSSIFYANSILSIIVYSFLFLVAPVIAHFYDEAILTLVLRVQGLRIVASSLCSIQDSLLTRAMKFKTLFICELIGALVQAGVGLVMAYTGFGVWAIVFSALSGYLSSGIGKIIASKWKPSLFYSYSLVKDALSFSSKILIIRFTRKLFYNIRTLTIGKVYTTDTLGYFNKGFQFPSTAMTIVDGSLTSVAFTSLSKLQNDKQALICALRNYVRIMMYLCTPMMIGMVIVAEPLVKVLLTDKWLACVPYLQIVCFTQLLAPLNVKTTAFEALGESSISMRLHVSSIVLSIILLFISIPYPAWVMVFSGFVSNLLLQIAIGFVCKKRMNYLYSDQLKDVFIGLIPTLGMVVIVFFCSYISCNVLLKLLLEIVLGIFAYVGFSALSKNPILYQMISYYKRIRLTRRNDVS